MPDFTIGQRVRPSQLGKEQGRLKEGVHGVIVDVVTCQGKGAAPIVYVRKDGQQRSWGYCASFWDSL